MACVLGGQNLEAIPALEGGSRQSSVANFSLKPQPDVSHLLRNNEHHLAIAVLKLAVPVRACQVC